ncbi:MAG: hypothetical protein GY756_07220 [bacterium]|nr:hypothetical protein [bacterium]
MKNHNIRNQIMVVGGYGDVGRTISIELGKKFPRNVIVAGRNYDKAEKLSAYTGKNVLPREIDIFSDSGYDKVLENVSLVIVCIDQKDTKFIEACIKRKINYVDITANYDFSLKVEKLNDLSKEYNTTTLISVGLSPGLTNLLTSYGKSKLDEMHQLDLYILGGLGESHGNATVNWFISKFSDKFYVYENGKRKLVKAFDKGKKSLFPENIELRKAYRFDFSDHQILAKNLKLDFSSMWVCFEPSYMSHLLYILRKLGIFTLLRFSFFKKLLFTCLKIKVGSSDLFIIKADCKGKKDNVSKIVSCSVSGSKEHMATGLFAADVAELMYTSEYPSGVFHIEQLMESPIDFIEKFTKRHGYRFTHTEDTCIK